MRLTIASAVLCTAFGAAGLAGAPSTKAARSLPPAPRPELHALFIGNSYLYYNNAPRLLEAIAEATDGPVVHTELVAHGGWTLADHWADEATQKVLTRRQWDWIVLNEQSTFGDIYLVDGQPRVHSSAAFEDSLAKFAGAARARGSRLAVVAHWPRRDAPARDAAALRRAFAKASLATGAVLVPAAAAWADAGRGEASASLYDADGSHPSPAGSYLLAGLIYATLTGRSPSGAPAAITGAAIEPDDGVVQPERQVRLVELPARVAARLQQTAWRAARRSAGTLRIAARAELPPIQLPRLPTGGEPMTAAALAGTWRGSTTIYPVSPEATLELTIRVNGAAFSGTLRRTLGPSPDGTETAEISVSVLENVVTIVDPKGPNGGSVVYKGVLRNGQLAGVAEFVIPVPGLYGIGRWTLTRAQ